VVQFNGRNEAAAKVDRVSVRYSSVGDEGGQLKETREEFNSNLGELLRNAAG
jgi:hypothetical protein